MNILVFLGFFVDLWSPVKPCGSPFVWAQVAAGDASSAPCLVQRIRHLQRFQHVAAGPTLSTGSTAATGPQGLPRGLHKGSLGNLVFLRNFLSF